MTGRGGLMMPMPMKHASNRIPESSIPNEVRKKQRISEGVSVFQLAANMGTSVEMIENFYGKKRMRDPKMATEVTKFRGR